MNKSSFVKQEIQNTMTKLSSNAANEFFKICIFALSIADVQNALLQVRKMFGYNDEKIFKKPLKDWMYN